MLVAGTSGHAMMSDKQESTAASCSRAACAVKGGGICALSSRGRCSRRGKEGPSEPAWHYGRTQCQ
eukprot:4405089-Pleurochrysis_carterae.AAC.2